MISSPLRASTSRPSTLMVTTSSWSAMCASVRREGAGTVLDVNEELVAEQADGRHDRAGDGRAERTDGGLLRRPAEAGGEGVQHDRRQGGDGGQLGPGAMLASLPMSRSRADSRPWPDSMLYMIFSAQPLPSRQGVH